MTTEQPYVSYQDDVENVKGFEFSEQSIRKGFIKKVYFILMIQLTITFGFVTLFALHEPTKKFTSSHPELLIIAFVIVLVTIIAMSCCESVRRTHPTNLVFLGIFTLAESFLVGVIASQYDGTAILMAVGITVAVCLALTIFAFQTKYDFTMCGGVLLISIVVFLIFGIVAAFIPGKVVSLVYASVGALLFSFYLIYDTQIMIGGNHKFAISPEEYVFAALSLYLDVINIFLYILSIIGAAKN